MKQKETDENELQKPHAEIRSISMAYCKGWVTYRFSYAMRHNDAINLTPSSPYYMRHDQIFNNINSFLKNVSNILDSKKGRFDLNSRLRSVALPQVHSNTYYFLISNYINGKDLLNWR